MENIVLLSHRSDRRPWTVLSLLLAISVSLAIGALVLHRQHYFERLYHGWYLQAAERAQELPRIDVASYRVAIDGKPVPGIERNLSGLTFDPDRELLWAVTNGPNELLALTKAGEVVRRYVLEGFEDVEGVAYFGDGQVAVVEERRQAVVVLSIPQAAEGRISRADQPALTLALAEADNKGFEGLTYDLLNDRLFIAKERDPLRVYRIDGLRALLRGQPQLKVTDLTEAMQDQLFARDLSSLAFDPVSGHLLLLSDESRLLMEFSAAGELLGYASLGRGFAGLAAGIPQAEGVTLDAQQTLYIISEPNLFYRFEKGDARSR